MISTYRLSFWAHEAKQWMEVNHSWGNMYHSWEKNKSTIPSTFPHSTETCCIWLASVIPFPIIIPLPLDIVQLEGISSGTLLSAVISLNSFVSFYFVEFKWKDFGSPISPGISWTPSPLPLSPNFPPQGTSSWFILRKNCCSYRSDDVQVKIAISWVS